MDIKEILLQAGINIANRMIADSREELNRQLREYVATYPTWGPPIGATIVEGSLANPIDDPSRLLSCPVER